MTKSSLLMLLLLSVVLYSSTVRVADQSKDETTMEDPGVLEKLANEVLGAAERIMDRVDEGVSILMNGGKLPPAPASSRDASTSETDFVDEDEYFPDGDVMGSPLEGIADGVLQDIMGGQSGPQTPLEHFHAFRSAIDWSEPFILALLVFHVVIIALCLWASRPNRSLFYRVTLMLFIGIMVRSSEWLNSYGAHHWQDFCTQNYFDRRGIFTGIFLSGPLMLNSFLMLVFFLREASQLLVQVKTMELKQKQEKQKKKRSNKTKDRASKKSD